MDDWETGEARGAAVGDGPVEDPWREGGAADAPRSAEREGSLSAGTGEPWPEAAGKGADPQGREADFREGTDTSAEIRKSWPREGTDAPSGDALSEDALEEGSAEGEGGEEKGKKGQAFSFLKEAAVYLLIIAVCLYVVPKFVIQRTIIIGDSMEDSLQDQDNVLVEKLSFLFGKPNRFDIVMFYPYGKDEEDYFVKRVIGLPGETIQIVGEDIYIDGVVLEEDYGKDPITFQGIAQEPIVLGEDEYFLMGDNREISFDSRYEEVGPVREDLIAGRAILRIWPFDKFGTVP